MHFFAVIVPAILLVASVGAQSGQSAIDPKCDRILNSMVDGCKSIRAQLVSPTSMEPKSVCCANARYNVCVQSVKGYAAVARITRICPEKLYTDRILELESQAGLEPMKKVCEQFETQTCITDPLQNAWNSVKTNVQSNVDVDQIQKQIGSNWNSAMASLSGLANSVQQSIQQQNIPGRLQAVGSSLQNSIVDRTKQLTDAVSGQGQNRYSLVASDGAPVAQDDSLSLDSIVHSVLPDVEIVPVGKNGPEGSAKVEVSSPPPAAPKTGGKRFSFNDWFGSLTSGFVGHSGVRNPSSSSSGPSSEGKTNLEQRANPYTVV